MKKVVKSLDIRKMAIIGVLGAISYVLGMTPLGFIPVGPTRATLMHIPVIIGAIMEGPLVGGLIGLIFGLLSIFQAATNPTPVSFVFLNPLVSVLPRIMIGIVTYYVYRFVVELENKKSYWILNTIWVGIIGYLAYGIYSNLIGEQSIWVVLINIGLIILTLAIGIYANKQFKDKAMDLILATIAGTITNTIGVRFTIYILYAEGFVEGIGQSVDLARKVIIGISITNGIPEIIIAIIIVTNVVASLRKRNI